MLAAALKPVNVSYSLDVDRQDEQVCFLGCSKGDIDAVKAASFFPSSPCVLRTAGMSR
ncbi:UNVERIFIED_CONTAM: hypothetical protein Q9R58_26790 [Methylobacteriaceae bacterium AG10]|nr:hypothetical protein [Methylobacteriaceae bacterium AG10]